MGTCTDSRIFVWRKCHVIDGSATRGRKWRAKSGVPRWHCSDTHSTACFGGAMCCIPRFSVVASNSKMRNWSHSCTVFPQELLAWLRPSWNSCHFCVSHFKIKPNIVFCDWCGTLREKYLKSLELETTFCAVDTCDKFGASWWGLRTI